MISLFFSGKTLLQFIVSGFFENSITVPEQILTIGYLLKIATCFSHLSGYAISSLSIRATSSFLQCFIPSFKAFPKPTFFSSRTTIKISPI